MPNTSHSRNHPSSTASELSLTNPDELTVLVFRDNNTPRTFQIPLGWITRLGFGVGALAFATLLTSFFAFKYYLRARQADPAHVVDLQQELSELRASNRALESKLAASTVSGPSAASTSLSPAAPQPIPTVTVTVTPLAVAVAPPVESTHTPVPQPVTQPAVLAEIPVFTALPHLTQDLTPAAAKLPIEISPAKTSWSSSGRTLKVKFNFEYLATDHGSQQGRIVILARGPNSLLAYPEGVLNRAGSEALITPHLGEYFSVSRFREVKAEFKNLHGPIQDIEVLILSLDGRLLSYEKYPAEAQPDSDTSDDTPAPAPKTTIPAVRPKAPEATPPAAAAITPPKARIKIAPTTPPSTKAELIEPGVDQ